MAGVSALVLAAVTSERARAERAMREIALTLQESLLPRQLPVVPRIHSAAYFRPAGQGQRVGGDFYDLFEAGDGSWALAVGDVVGKGPRAAGQEFGHITGLERRATQPRPAHLPPPNVAGAAITERLPERGIDQSHPAGPVSK